MGRTATTVFNVLHQPAIPAVLTGLGLVPFVPPIVLVSGLVWIGHVLIDRALGDGRRSIHPAHR
jgi:hypothetical protein